jgi:hypothetical protein
MSAPDFSVLPADLAELYSGFRQQRLPNGGELFNGVEQLCLPVESPAAEFRRWLEAQPLPDYLGAVAP